MTGEIFFNGRQWRDFGLNEQQVKFLELLFNRAGGSQEVTLNLSQLGDSITNIEGSLRQYDSVIKKLEHRINQLENEV